MKKSLLTVCALLVTLLCSGGTPQKASKARTKAKTIAPFTTHEGSGLGSCVRDIKKTYPKATVLNGLSIYGHSVRDGKEKVAKWIKGM